MHVGGDVSFQLDHVARAAWRLLALQDRDPNSPSFGCFHTAYWRDKTSEFPDARFQECGAALGLLSLTTFDGLRTIEVLPSRGELMDSFIAGAVNLSRQQYSDGSYDEWYKGERGFAATAFTTVHYGLAALNSLFGSMPCGRVRSFTRVGNGMLRCLLIARRSLVSASTRRAPRRLEPH